MVITGTGLGVFGGVAGSIVGVPTDTTVTVLTAPPAAAGLVAVAVALPGQDVAVLPVTGQPLPPIVYVGLSELSVCYRIATRCRKTDTPLTGSHWSDNGGWGHCG